MLLASRNARQTRLPLVANVLSRGAGLLSEHVMVYDGIPLGQMWGGERF